jgi:hypothetical protein
LKSHKLAPYVKPAVIALICIMLVVAATLTGCQLSSIASKNNAPAQTPSEIEGETNLNKDVENDKNEPEPSVSAPVVPYNVLTGLETTSELAGLRPVAVCIENSAYSLPQYGLENAQVLIEVPLEDGGTRLMMLTTDYRYVTTIGAVSSTRSYLLELGAAFDAIQCFNGTDDTVSADVLANYDTLDNLSDVLAGVYYTDPTRFSENDLMTNGILLDSAVRRAEINETLSASSQMPYQFVQAGTTTVPADGKANTVTIRYSTDLNVSYTYDSTSGKYLRSQFGSAQIDGNTAGQIGFDNLFILYSSSVTYEREDGKSLDLVIEDGGSGYYMSNGGYERITWSRTADGTLRFYDAQGNILSINRGTSYIGMVTAGAMDTVGIR